MGKIIATLILGDIAFQVAKNPFLAGVELADFYAWWVDTCWVLGMTGFQFGLFLIACFVAIPVVRGVFTICKAVVDSAKEMTRYKI